MVIVARNSITFLLGLGFAFLPAYGPFLSLLFIFSARWTLKRSDLLWWAAALLLALPLAVHGGARGFLFGALQVLAPWLIYRAFAQLPGKRLLRSGGLLSLGLLVGLGLIVGLGGLRLEAPGVLAGNPLWLLLPSDPALYGHTAFVLGALIAILVPDSKVRLLSLFVSAAGILLSGSREVAIAWLIVAAALFVADIANLQGARGKRLLEALFLGVMLLAAVGLGPLLGWQREGFLVNILPTQTSSSTAAPGGPSGEDLSLSTARLPYWQAALGGGAQKPLLGWGRGNFPAYYQTHRPASDQLQGTPSHAHNLFLQIFFARGAVGALGLLLFLLALIWAAWRKRDLAFLLVFAAILFANVFDYTLFYGDIIYPLAAVAGWRAAAYQQAERRRDSAIRQFAVRLSLALVDFAVALLAFSAAIVVRRWVGAWLGLSPLVFPAHFGAMVYAFLLWPALAWFEGLYPGYGLTPPQELKKQVLGVLYAGILLAAGTVLFYKELAIPRSVLFLTVFFSLFVNPWGRALAKRLLRYLGLWGRPVVILGAGRTGRRVARALLNRPLDGLTPCAFFDDDSAKRGLELDGLTVQGSLSEAVLMARREGVRHAIVAIPHLSAEVLAPLTGAGQAFRRVQFVPDLRGMPVYGVSAGSLDNLLALEVHNALASPANRAFKRTLDLLGVVVGGLLVSPVLLALALAVYLDSPGPVFFGHRRLGRGGKPFTCWKFRTMVPHAQEMLETYLHEHPEARREWEETYKLQNDPRITRVGKVLRKYSLDELPQLWNVFWGQMSLVGPRPIVTDEISRYAGSYELYKLVRPGMAGLWQVSGRNDTDYAGRVALDNFYVRNWSVWLDITILTAIPQAVLKSKGAY